MPSSSSSSSSSPTYPISAFELGTLVLDERMVELTNRIFEDDDLTIAYLRHYIFITRGIHRAEYELDQLQHEQRTIHEYVMASPHFRRAIQPIVRTYRRRTRQSGLHPYTRQPLNINQPCSPPTSQSSPPSSIPSQPSTSSLSSKSTQPPNDIQPGSANYPIDVDDNDDHDKTKTVKKPKFEPVCERCGKQGHDKPDCDTPIRSFTHCRVCEWMKKPQETCDHHDVSPAQCKRLRGNKIPYLEELD